MYDEVNMDFKEGIAKVGKYIDKEEVMYNGTYTDYSTTYFLYEYEYINKTNQHINDAQKLAFIKCRPYYGNLIQLTSVETEPKFLTREEYLKWKRQHDIDKEREEREAERKKQIRDAQNEKDNAVFKQLEKAMYNDIISKGYVIGEGCKHNH